MPVSGSPPEMTVIVPTISDVPNGVNVRQRVKWCPPAFSAAFLKPPLGVICLELAAPLVDSGGVSQGGGIGEFRRLPVDRAATERLLLGCGLIESHRDKDDTVPAYLGALDSETESLVNRDAIER